MQINQEKIVRAFEENPVAFMAAAGTVLVGLSKFLHAGSDVRNSRTYAREVKRRIRKDHHQ